MSLYLFASKISGSFSPKAQKFYKSRRNLLKQIKEETKDTASVSKGNRYWFHCASAGEFEQARPLIESIKENTPSAFIVVTFFSPSGYELRKDYSLANHVFYLPMDNSSNVRQFLDCIRPDHAIFIKYEFWYNYLKNLNKRGIPVYLVSANFMKTQPFFKWWGFFFRRMLRYFTHIFVQDVGSEELLAEIGISNVSVAGDTRFDRVSKVAQSKRVIPELEVFTHKVDGAAKSTDNSFVACLVAGSTWPEDEEMLHHFLGRFGETSHGKLKVIIAPHETGKEHIDRLELLFQNYKVVKFSKVEGKHNEDDKKREIEDADLFIIDQVGFLSYAYHYGNFAYVGGGFGAGIHNTLEPVASGLPVVFGPKHQKFIEAYGLLSCGAGFAISNLKGYMPGKVDIMNILAVNEKFRSEASEYGLWYIGKNKGATNNILKKIAP